MLDSERKLDPTAPAHVFVERNVMVPMRDGVRLATDIYRPAIQGLPVEGRFPVILERTPYGKGEVSRSERTARDMRPKARSDVAAYFVRHGYVVVYQDTRGRYDSQGEFVKYLSDGTDGYDTLAWLRRQYWCDGKIGTMGLSYAAHTQSALACLDPPGLAAMFLDSGGFSNAYQGGIRQGGAFELKQATWAFNNALLSPELAAAPAKLKAMRSIDLRSWFAHMPWRRGHSPLALAPAYEDYLFEQWQKGTFDSYWQQNGIYAAGAWETYADVPVVHMSSWYDPYPRTAIENYLGLKDRKKGPVRLILGPWTHGDRSVTFAGDVDFGPAATLDGHLAEDFLALRRRWFDRWLRGINNGVDREPAVRLFVMGGGSGRRNQAGRLDHGGAWRAAPDFPLPGTRATPLYLHADGSLGTQMSPEAAATRQFDYDPRRPVPTIGGAISSGEPLMVAGAFDQVEDARFFGCTPPYRKLAERPDVLVFETPPLAEDAEVIGAIVVRLWVSSNCPDTDFTAKLIDVHPANDDYPDGFAMNLTDGILRLRYRDSWEQPRLTTPGDVHAITITAFPTANLFKRGHRIRLDISSSNFPRFDLNPNTGEPEGAWRETRVATNTVHLDREHPSCVILPIVPAKR